MRYPIKDKSWGWPMDPFEVFAHWDSWRTSPNLTFDWCFYLTKIKLIWFTYDSVATYFLGHPVLVLPHDQHSLDSLYGVYDIYSHQQNDNTSHKTMLNQTPNHDLANSTFSVVGVGLHKNSCSKDVVFDKMMWTMTPFTKPFVSSVSPSPTNMYNVCWKSIT